MNDDRITLVPARRQASFHSWPWQNHRRGSSSRGSQIDDSKRKRSFSEKFHVQTQSESSSFHGSPLSHSLSYTRAISLYRDQQLPARSEHEYAPTDSVGTFSSSLDQRKRNRERNSEARAYLNQSPHKTGRSILNSGHDTFFQSNSGPGQNSTTALVKQDNSSADKRPALVRSAASYGSWISGKLSHKKSSKQMSDEGGNGEPHPGTAAFALANASPHQRKTSISWEINGTPQTLEKDGRRSGHPHASKTKPTLTTRKSAFARSKSFIKKKIEKLKAEPHATVDEDMSIKSKTAEILKQASVWLNYLLDHEKKAQKHMHHDKSALAVLLRQQRSNTDLSSSSSVIQLMMGKAPKPTPDPDSMYMGDDGQEYFKVEISDPKGPTFLPSEARRIGTPPLSTLNSILSSPECYFPDLGLTEAEAFLAFEDEKKAEKWCEDALPVPAKLSGFARWQGFEEPQGVSAVKKFRLKVPDHLPGTPLCPASILNESKGKGICVLHGRRRS